MCFSLCWDSVGSWAKRVARPTRWGGCPGDTRGRHGYRAFLKNVQPCSATPEMRNTAGVATGSQHFGGCVLTFKFLDKVKVVKGFYEGHVGTIEKCERGEVSAYKVTYPALYIVKLSPENGLNESREVFINADEMEHER